MNTFNNYFLLALLSIQIFGCSQSQSTHMQEAEAICAIYSPQNLQQAVSGKDLLATVEYVNNRLRETVKSQEMKAIVEKLAREGNPDFYAALQQEISTLIGKTWSCKDAKNFYVNSWQTVESSQAGVLIEISVVEGKYYQIDNTDYDMAKTEDIKIVLDTLADSQPYTIQLSIPAGTDPELLNQYLEPLRKIGVKKLSVVEVK